MVIFFFIPFKLSSKKDKTIVTESKSGIAQARNKFGAWLQRYTEKPMGWQILNHS